MQVDRHNILWHRQVMSVQWALVSRPVTVAALLGGRWSSPHFDVIFFPLPVIFVRLWRMLSAACQRWGNVWRSDNASVLWSVKWWKWPVITGIIKTVRGSSMDGFVYCLALTASQAFGPPLPHTPNECGFVLVGINITTKPQSWNEFTILNKKIQFFFCVCVFKKLQVANNVHVHISKNVRIPLTQWMNDQDLDQGRSYFLDRWVSHHWLLGEHSLQRVQTEESTPILPVVLPPGISSNLLTLLGDTSFLQRGCLLSLLPHVVCSHTAAGETELDIC